MQLNICMFTTCVLAGEYLEEFQAFPNLIQSRCSGAGPAGTVVATPRFDASQKMHTRDDLAGKRSQNIYTIQKPPRSVQEAVWLS